MSEAIVNSFNFYFNSDRDRAAGSTGDNIQIPLNETPITCGTNQFLRLSLQSFSMYAGSLPQVNIHNAIFRVSCERDGGGGSTLVNFPTHVDLGNYASKVDLMIEFGTKLQALITACTGTNPTATNPVQHMSEDFVTTSAESLDGIIRLKLNFIGAHNVKESSLMVKFVTGDGDAFALLGGDRCADEGTAANQTIFSSISIDTTSDTDSILVLGHYNVQLSTEQNTFLKCDLNTTAIQTTNFSALSSEAGSSGAGTESSRILGRIVNDTGFSTFTTNTQMEYFVNLTSKSLTSLRLFITDSKGREIAQNIPRTLELNFDLSRYSPKLIQKDFGDDIGGTNTVPLLQTTLGNRSFEGCIKVDVCQFTAPRNNTLQSKPPVIRTPPRYTSNLLTIPSGDYYPVDECSR